MDGAAALGGGMSAPEGALDVLQRDRAVLVVVDLQEKLVLPYLKRDRSRLS